MRTKLKGTRGCKNNSPLIPEAISIIKNNVNNDDKLSETNISNSPFLNVVIAQKTFQSDPIFL